MPRQQIKKLQSTLTGDVFKESDYLQHINKSKIQFPHTLTKATSAS